MSANIEIIAVWFSLCAEKRSDHTGGYAMTGTNYPQLKAGLLDKLYQDGTREYVLTTFEGSIINTRQIMRFCSACLVTDVISLCCAEICEFPTIHNEVLDTRLGATASLWTRLWKIDLSVHLRLEPKLLVRRALRLPIGALQTLL